MNARMTHLLDQLAQQEAEEHAPGYMEILPPLQTEMDRSRGFDEAHSAEGWVGSYVSDARLEMA